MATIGRVRARHHYNSGTVDGEGFGDIPCFDIKLTSG